MLEIEQTLEERKAIIEEFANRFGLTFEQEGLIGFARKCVGLSIENYYVVYNPINYYNPNQDDFMDFIKDLYDERFYEIAPANSDNKGSCLAVMGWGVTAIIELSNWIEKLNELDVIVERYTDSCGINMYALRMPAKRVHDHWGI
jgi:hypothetical protein